MFEAIQEADFQILDWIQQNMRTPWLDWLMPKITFLGEAGLIWILLAFIFLMWKPQRRCGVKMLVGLAGGFLLLTTALKNLIARSRPCWIIEEMEMLIKIPKDYSFPSGHSLAGFTAAVIIFRHDRRLGIPALILASVIAFSRLYLYVHFPTDVLAGVLLGILAGIVADILIERVITARTGSEKTPAG